MNIDNTFDSLDMQSQHNPGTPSGVLPAVGAKRGGRRTGGSAGQARGVRTVAQAIKALIGNAQWSVDAMHALLDKREVRSLSPVDQRREALDCDVAWAAGLFDGEGCISIARHTYAKTGRRPSYRMRLQLCQNNLQTLQEFE